MPSCFESILGVTVESVQGNQVYLERIGTSGSFLVVAQPLVFLFSFTLRLPSLELRWECWDSFPNEKGNGPSSRDEEGKTGLFLSCLWHSILLSSGDRYVGLLFELPKGCQGPF